MMAATPALQEAIDGLAVRRSPKPAPRWRVLFVSSGNGKRGVDVLVKAQGDSLEAAGIHVDHFLVVGRGIGGYLRAVRPLRERLQSEHYDLVHAHYGYCGIVAQLARSHQPLVVSFMGTDLLGPMNHDGTYRRLGTLITNVNRRLLPVFVDYCIAKSTNLRQSLNSHRHVAVVPNGIDFSTFYPVDRDSARRQLGLEPARKYVLFVGDPKRAEKNFELARAAVDAMNSPDVTLLALHGVPQSIVNLHYSAVDAIVLTSYYEGSPNAIKEAMACNCPIVTVDVGDVAETIRSTRGCHVVGLDVASVAGALQQVLARSERTDGRTRIADLSAALVAGRIAAIYEATMRTTANRGRGAS